MPLMEKHAFFVVLSAIAFVYFLNLETTLASKSPYDWMSYDNFDRITDFYDSVNAENCHSKPTEELYMPEDVLAQMPRFNRLLTNIVYPNRTRLLHVHNMALNRAFFYSYIFQKLNSSETFMQQPGLMYYYFSAAADVSANEYNINGSAIFFDNNCSYATWYRDLPFNQTLDLFGARAWRYDDYNDPTNWLREPTNHTIDILDYGAGPQSNYTHDSYKLNQWYDRWLPDGWNEAGLDSVRKHTYDVSIKYSNETGVFESDEFVGKTFFGPPSPGQRARDNQPVVWTQPYFDCGRSNKWIVSAVAPVLDHLPRYLEWRHIRRHRFVAVSTQDIDFLSIDINPCPLSIGNELPNYFAGTARCKPTTMCEPLYGWGFRRGGYMCMCAPGYRYPPWQTGPFQGIEIESATQEEYENGFDCIPVELRIVLPTIHGNETYGTPTSRIKRSSEFNGPLNREEMEQAETEALQQQMREVEEKRKAYEEAKRKREEEEKEKERIAEEKRKAEELEDNEKRPWFGENHKDLSALVLPDSLSSVVLKKKLKFLRLIGLKEEADHKGRQKIVPRTSFTFEAEKQRMNREPPKPKQTFIPRYKRDTGEAKSRQKRQSFDQLAYERIYSILNHKESINKDNCMNFKDEDLELPGDVAYNVEKVFSNQARTALRLSHFLSNFMQNIDAYEEYGNLRGDSFLNVEQLFGEVLANVMGDLKLKGSGIFFDTDKFLGPDGKIRQYFGPYAYRYDDEEQGLGGNTGDQATSHFRAIDFAGFEDNYLDEPWYKFVKERWQANTYGLTEFTEKPMIRSDLDGLSLRKFEMYPMYYHAPNEEDGWWSAPYFDCDGYVNDWIITYSIPFFGLNSIGSALEFKGVVTVDIRLDELDINQCPMDFHVPNAFKGTARCHYEDTVCTPIEGKKFVQGSYKCDCTVGFEYPFMDRAWYFDGQTMEEEYSKKVQGIASRYDTLHCRIGGASGLAATWYLGLITITAVLLQLHL